jgi:zinc/manganese transport system permease protein
VTITFLLTQPFAQHALLAAALVAVSCGLIGPFVVTRGMAFAVHGTAELAFTGAAAGLLAGNNPVAGALVGSLVVAALIATLGSRPRERDSAIGAILAFGMGIGILLLGYYQGFATAATNILFGDIFGVSGSQLLILVIICLIVVAVMAVWYRPLLFASVDPEAAKARGVPVRRLGLVFLLVLALTVTGATQVVGTLLVLSLAITPAAAAQRLSARPLAVAALSVVFTLIAADGGLLASFGASDVKASVFITSTSFGIYLAGPLLRDRSREGRRTRPGHAAHPRHMPWPGQARTGNATPPEGGPPQEADSHVPSGLGWPRDPAIRREADSQHLLTPRGKP